MGTTQSIHDGNLSEQAVKAVPAVSNRPLLLRLFSRRWLLATILVVIGVAINIRLGIWQLDRLEQRRAFNTRVLAQINQPVLELTGNALNADLANMEYRKVTVVGEYDLANEVALRNQAWGNRPGVHVLTPLRIQGSDQVILVNRGWVPVEEGNFDRWAEYPETGVVRVEGILRASQSTPDYGRRSDPVPAEGEAPLKAWYFANIEAISRQVPYPLLPAYIQQAPGSSLEGPPYRTQPELDLTEGPHQSYALQWFSFAIVLGLGYPFFVRRQERKHLAAHSTNPSDRSS